MAYRYSYTARMHPNGFLQIEVDKIRLHVWHPDMPKGQTVRTPIHDHVFNFESKILTGELVHIEYDFIKKPENYSHYRLYASAYEELIPTHETGDFIRTNKFIFKKGDIYRFHAFDYHQSQGLGFTVTRIKKLGTWPHIAPTIGVPIHRKPDNDFRRDQYQAS